MNLSAYLALAAFALFAPTPAQKAPVLLELFTSLGCSSCPPADKLLAEIDRQQPIQGARVIVLSEHVDYWDSPQWNDPFSSRSYTTRQQAYDERLHAEAYTPQAVVNGTKAVIGNDWSKVSQAIQGSLPAAGIAVHVTATRDGNKANFEVDAGPNASEKKAAVFLALAHDRTESHVGGGENAGRDINQVAVVYTLKEIGKVEPGKTFNKTVSLPLAAKSSAGDTRVVAILSNSGTLQVLGADETVF